MDTFFNYMAYALTLVGIALIVRFIYGLGNIKKVENRPRDKKHNLYRWDDHSSHRDLR